MTLFALGLVLVSGTLHAVWNLLAKRASGGASGPAFVWLYSALSTVIFAPLAAGVFMGGGRLGALGLLFVFGTGALHVGYFLACATPCKQLDGLQPGLMRAVLDRDEEGNPFRKAGVTGLVVAGGEVRPGDAIRVELPPGPRRPLEKV